MKSVLQEARERISEEMEDMAYHDKEEYSAGRWVRLCVKCKRINDGVTVCLACLDRMAEHHKKEEEKRIGRIDGKLDRQEEAEILVRYARNRMEQKVLEALAEGKTIQEAAKMARVKPNVASNNISRLRKLCQKEWQKMTEA